MDNLRSKAWILGALLVFPACDKGDGMGPGDQPEMADESMGKKGGDAGNDTNKDDNAADSTNPKDDSSKGGNDENNGDSSSEDKSGDDSNGDKLIDCKSLKPTGLEIGDIPENLTLLAANGDEVSLHDHCNKVLFIMTGTAD